MNQALAALVLDKQQSMRQLVPALARPRGYPAVAGRRLRWCIAILGALPLALLAAWIAAGEGWSPRSALALLLWLACCGWALAAASGPPALLYWDGAAWWLRSPARPPAGPEVAVTGLRIAIDGQRWLLLRASDAAANPAAWLEMRRCLYSTVY